MEGNKIYNTVKQRINRTEKVLDQFNKPTSKEIYARENEKGQPWAGDRYNPSQMRVMAKYNEISNLARKNEPKQSEVDYYKKCVDNTQSNLNVQEYVENDAGTRKKLQMQYNQDLNNQIEQKKKLQNQMYNEQNEKYLKQKKEIDDAYNKQRQLDLERKKLISQDLNQTNQAMIQNKLNRYKDAKNSDNTFYQNANNEALQSLVNEDRYIKENLYNQKNSYNQGLKNQLTEKEKRLQDQKRMDVDLNKLRGINIGERHCNMKNCKICHRAYDKMHMSNEQKYNELLAKRPVKNEVIRKKVINYIQNTEKKPEVVENIVKTEVVETKVVEPKAEEIRTEVKVQEKVAEAA